MFGKSKKKVAEGINWKNLEKEAAKHKILKGYKVETQKRSKRTRERPDVFGINPKNSRDRIIIDAKCTENVTPDYINQVKGYKRTFFAKKAAIITAHDTKISHQIRREAKDANIRIIRGNTKRRISGRKGAAIGIFFIILFLLFASI